MAGQTNIRKLVVVITQNSAQFHKGITRVQSRITSLKNSVFSLKGALVGIGGALVVKSFINVASEVENLGVRMRVLLGSVEEGGRLFNEMQKFASRVPFEFRQIFDAATALSGVVKGGADEVIKLMPLIGDLAAASGLSLQETTGQMIRVMSAGIGAADLFRERGITAMLGFQAGVAKTAKESMDQVIAEWNKGGSKFKGATQLLAQTWTGQVSLMSDKWFLFRNQVMKSGIFDFMITGLKLTNKLFDDSGDSINQFAKEFGEGALRFFKSMALGAAGFIDAVRPSVKAMFAVIDAVFQVWNRQPAWLKEFGIIGALLGGTKLRFAIAGFLLINSAIDTFKEKLGFARDAGGSKPGGPTILGLVTGIADDGDPNKSVNAVKAGFQAIENEMDKFAKARAESVQKAQGFGDFFDKLPLQDVTAATRAMGDFVDEIPAAIDGANQLADAEKEWADAAGQAARDQAAANFMLEEAEGFSREYVIQTQRLVEETEKARANTEAFADIISSSFASGIVNAQTFSDILRDIAKQLIQIGLQMTIKGGIMQAFEFPSGGGTAPVPQFNPSAPGAGGGAGGGGISVGDPVGTAALTRGMQIIHVRVMYSLIL